MVTGRFLTCSGLGWAGIVNVCLSPFSPSSPYSPYSPSLSIVTNCPQTSFSSSSISSNFKCHLDYMLRPRSKNHTQSFFISIYNLDQPTQNLDPLHKLQMNAPNRKTTNKHRQRKRRSARKTRRATHKHTYTPPATYSAHSYYLRCGGSFPYAPLTLRRRLKNLHQAC